MFRIRTLSLPFFLTSSRRRQHQVVRSTVRTLGKRRHVVVDVHPYSSLSYNNSIKTIDVRRELLPSPYHTPQYYLQNQLRSIHLQTQDTPNPDSLKIISNVPVLPSTNNQQYDTSGYYITREDTDEQLQRSPLALQLFDSVKGIQSIFLGSNFITITKYTEEAWDPVRVKSLRAITDFYISGKQPVLIDTDTPHVTDTTIFDTDSDAVAMIKELLETRIRPTVMEDGGDIRYVKFEEETGLVYVQLAGSCVGCPSSSVTLKNGVENMMKHYVEEVKGVVAIEEDKQAAQDDSSTDEEANKQRTYEERLATAGIPYAD